MSIVLLGSTSGSITLQEPAVAGSTVLNLPATSGTLLTTATPFSNGQGPAFSAYGSAAQSIPNATYTKVAFNTELFDTANCFDSTTNYRFTPNVAGYYQINATITSNTAASGGLYLGIFKNGSIYTQGNVIPLSASVTPNCVASQIIDLNGVTDYIEIYVYQNSGGNLNAGSNGQNQIFSGALVRAA